MVKPSSRLSEEERGKPALGRMRAPYSGARKLIWDHYNDMASGVDASREVEWGELAEMTLLFAGLFAAVLSAFLVYTIPQLQPNSTDVSKDILLQISLQLSNSSVPAYIEPQFFVPINVAAVNALLFTSLALVLLDAYLAVLTRSWLRDFDRDLGSSNVPEERARAREMRFQGLMQWKMPWIVALLPLVIQASLGLFFGALIIMLFDLHRPTAYSTLVILAAGLLFYISTTVVSALDTNAPFTSPVSKALRALINIRWSQLRQGFSIALSYFNWRPGNTTWKSADNARVIQRLEGTETHLAIYNRLYAVTSKAVENLPVFTALFDQWVHTPRLRPRSMTDWRPILPLIQPYLSSTSLSKNFGLRSVARLFLCFNLQEQKAQQAIVEALKEHNGDTTEPISIDQLYIHLLHQPDPDWSLASQVVLKLESDSDTIIELRWILNWIIFRFLDQSQEFPNKRDMRDIIPFLRSTAIYIIQNRIVNDDHRLFDLLLLITRLIANDFGEVDETHPSTKARESQVGSNVTDGGLFVSISDFLVPPESQWKVVRALYAASFTSAAGFNRDFTLLVILLMIGTLSAVEYSRVDASITYDPCINLKKDLPVLMDGLWETWQANNIDHRLLIGIALWLLTQSRGSFRKPSPNEQHSSFQEMLNAYDSYTRGAIPLMTSSAHQFIGAALSFNLTLFNWGIKWRPQTLELKNPWLVMHIHNILRCEWRIPGSTMREAVWGRLERITPSNRFGRVERLDILDILDRLDLLDHQVDQVDQVDQLPDHLLDQLLNHLLDQQIDQQIHHLLDQQIEQINQMRQLLQTHQQLPRQRLEERLEEHLQQLDQQHLHHCQIHQVLLQMLPKELQEDQKLPHVLQRLLQQLQQLQHLFPQFPQLMQKFQRLPQIAQQLIQTLKHQREQEFNPQLDYGPVQAFAQVLQQEDVKQEIQRFFQECLPPPPLDIPRDPPLPPLPPPDSPLSLDPPLPPLSHLDPPLPSLDPPLPSLDPPLPSLDLPLPSLDLPLPSLDPPLPSLDPPLPSLDLPLPTLNPPLLSLDPPLDPPSPPLPYLQKLFPSLLEPLLSGPLSQLPQFQLFTQLEQQLGRIDQLSKQRDNQLFNQREALLEQLYELRVQCAQWLRQWLQQLGQEFSQELSQQFDQQEEQLRQLKLRQLRHWLKQLDLQRSTALEAIARERLELYNVKELGPDLVALSLFLSPRNKDIFDNSRRLILEFFRSTPSQPPLSLPNITGVEVDNSEAAGLICSEFFYSNVVGDLTKWRLLASVVFREWKTLSAQWKDHIAVEIVKVDGVGRSRVDWMARVTPLLEGEFNLFEFGLSDHDTCGHLTPTHLRMMATAMEHLGAKRFARQKVHELEDFLEQHSNILVDKEALNRIRMVIKSTQQS